MIEAKLHHGMNKASRPHRPLSVTLTALGVLFFAVFYLFRLQQAVAKWDFLSQVLPFSPIYLALSGALWGLSGVIVAVAIWLGLRWAVRAVDLLAIVFAIYYAFSRLVWPGRSLDNYNLPFWLAAILIVGLLMHWVLTRPRAKTFFGEQYEHQPQN